jgi:hypothetical protein
MRSRGRNHAAGVASFDDQPPRSRVLLLRLEHRNAKNDPSGMLCMPLRPLGALQNNGTWATAILGEADERAGD